MPADSDFGSSTTAAEEICQDTASTDEAHSDPCFTICFTICLCISPDLDGHQGTKNETFEVMRILTIVFPVPSLQHAAGAVFDKQQSERRAVCLLGGIPVLEEAVPVRLEDPKMTRHGPRFSTRILDSQNVK
jgi:hypothetical protein